MPSGHPPRHQPDELPAHDAHRPSEPPATPACGAARLDVTGCPLDEAAGWQRVTSSTDLMDDPQEWAAYLASWHSQVSPPDAELYPELFPDPDGPPPDGDPEDAEILAWCRQAAADQAALAERAARLGTTGALAVIAAASGRRGPGMPGSAQQILGEYAADAAGFATGYPLDVAPGCLALMGFAEDAAGDDDRYTGASDDELIGALCAWDRIQATASSRKHAAVAELIRRRPRPGEQLTGEAQMPQVWDEFTDRELSHVLAESPYHADAMLGLAMDLEVKLPGTKAAFRAGILRESKAAIIAAGVETLDPAEAREAEALVLGRAGRLSPGGLRAAIARAAMQVAPGKACKRREHAARRARVERLPEHSGNAALFGRELPPAEVIAADQRISWWARELKDAGVTGTTDQLRARAYLDLLLGISSRPAQPSATRTPGRPVPGRPAPGQGGSGPLDPDGPFAPPWAGAVPPGFAGRLHLTVPLVTLGDLADRPGEITGIGPVDPALARDLARATATNPKTTWCFTVTDEQGHAIGHGCARPEPRSRPKRREKRQPTAPRDGPGYTFTRTDEGPPGGYGTWRFTTGIPGQRALLVTLDPIPVDTCDHRYEAAGHDPGVTLRHLAQIRHANCTGPTCRHPAETSDFEHNTPYEAGGRTCLCNGGPKCRREHRLKQHPRWKVDQPTPSTFSWTTPSGRSFITEPTRYPI